MRAAHGWAALIRSGRLPLIRCVDGAGREPAVTTAECRFIAPRRTRALRALAPSAVRCNARFARAQSRTVNATSTRMLSPVTRSAAAVYWRDCPSRSTSVLLDSNERKTGTPGALNASIAVASSP